jgi:pimeloyl-ACP methyl ester carboxylesterase
MARKNKRKRSIVGGLLRGLNWLFRNLLFASGLWILYSRFVINHKAALSPAVDGERKEMDGQAAGRLSYYYEPGKGRPLVLLHSINAAASAYEMKPLFEHYRGRRPVYALDLPGYGFSDHSPREYTPEVFTTAIAEFLETQVGKAADVAALSLSAEFAARVALEKPELVHSLALISPAGMTVSGSASQRAGQAGASQRLHEFFAAPLWGQALFDLIATRASIRYFLGRSFVGPVPADLVDYDYATSHQPGAEIAPLYFISGALFTPDALESLYKKVVAPGLVIYDQDAYTGFDGLPGLLEACPNWRAHRLIPSKGLPHFERLEETVKALDDLWARAD